MADLVLERDAETLAEQKRLRHERYRALVGTNTYEEHAKRAFGESASRGGTAEMRQDKDYVANRVKNASDVAKGVYTMPRTQFPQDYAQPAPDWSYAKNLSPMQESEYGSETEETEDERPTPTTTQYMTLESAKALPAAEIADEYFSLSASAKIVIAVLITVVIAIAALIWVNASVISTLAEETAAIETLILQKTEILSEVQKGIELAQSEEVIREFAESIGMILG